jgi:hypothetical protein
MSQRLIESSFHNLNGPDRQGQAVRVTLEERSHGVLG